MKTVLITGASSGLGIDLAMQYAALNYNVIACGRDQSRLEQLSQASANISTLSFDITEPAEVEAAISTLQNIDIAILNAGDCQYIDDAKNFDGNLFAQIIKVNLISIGYLLQYILPKMPENSQLALMSSSVTLLPLPRAEAYGASKAGLDYLANTLRLDLAKDKIDVCLIHPGFIKTPLTDKNTFDMPFIMESSEAATRVITGLTKRKHYIQFPKRFTFLLRVLASLPTLIWLKIITRKS